MFSFFKKKFLSPIEIAYDIIKTMKNEDIIKFAEADKSTLIRLHHGTGKNIRNKYKLWDVQNPYTKIRGCRMKNGVNVDVLFPDNLSQKIIEFIALECKSRLNKNDKN